MVTVAYCRVSTREQAEEGFSIDGQTAKLRAYARLHDLGDVVVVSDPGVSGKNLHRPGLQRLLSMVDRGEVANVLLWRLDRLSRNLGDLIELADRFGTAGVGLHSVTEQLDLGSATGRMFFNILGSFAQFYREQLSENVAMGQGQARREGRWVNRPPTGYDLRDGYLVPNADAATVARIFGLRAAGASQARIAAATGISQSTVGAILRNRAYVGEIRHGERWLPGGHLPIVAPDVFEAVQRRHGGGVRRGVDPMSGRVRCGLCGRSMSVQQNGQGQRSYRCKHRGHGCDLASRSARGLRSAAELGVALLADDEQRSAIRRHLETARRADEVRRRPAPGVADAVAALHDQENKLLGLYYADDISADLFAREHARIRADLEQLEPASSDDTAADPLAEFEALIHRLDQTPDRHGRQHLVDELVDHVSVHPDRLRVHLHGAPPLGIHYAEVGLRHSENGPLLGVS